MESPSAKKGDPQRSALIQFLMDRFGSANDTEDPSSSMIVDFGSGKGVLAHEIDRLFPESAELPHYVAVDLPDALNELALPRRIHNKSTKLSLEEFYDAFLPARGSDIGVIVIRNVLHELDIMETARLFCALNQHIPDATDLYIQDVATLPEHERGKAGWMPELLQRFMSAIGIESDLAEQEGYLGTQWYILRAALPGTAVSIGDVVAACSCFRQAQHDELLQQIDSLNQLTDEASAARLIQLEGDCSSISIQLMQCQALPTARAQQISAVAELMSNRGIYLTTDEMGEHDYCLTPEEDLAKQSGLVAILSNKSIIDFPSQYRSCKKELLFSGYSLRSLFLHDGNRLAIESLLQKGIPVRLLLVDPQSEAAIARAEMPAYGSQDGLCQSIDWTIQQAHSLRAKLLSEHEHCSLELRLTRRHPPCSFFFADNLCFLSLYSNRATGSRGQCFVYSSGDGAFSSYYHFLIEDFRGDWDRALEVEDG